MVDWLADKQDEFLKNTYPATGYTYKFYLDGLVHHDAYHMGQIGLLIKMQRHPG